MEATGSGRRVAVVFIHGMGEQRRYADTAQLATRLIAHAAAQAASSDSTIAQARGAAVALTWDEGQGPADRRPRARVTFDAEIAGVPTRFHDVYWAPLVSGRTTFRSLWRWLRGRYLRPIGYFAARWASHAQLKVTALQEGRGTLTPLERTLLDDYVSFAEAAHGASGADRQAADFGAFLAYLDRTHHDPGEGGFPAAALKRRARAWRNRYGLEMLLTLVRSLPLLLALTAAILAVPMTAAWLAARMVRPPDTPGLVVALVVGVLWFLSFPLMRLLVRTLGDVEVYATYTEASERHAAHEAVVEQATGVLRRALTDPGTSRVLLVGHSLGSVVAWDALRALALEAESGGPLTWYALGRLDRVITYGSPVDKIRFFHFADDLHDPTFAAALEAQRVDTRFGRFGERVEGLAWDNYYDPADLVAGRLESPNDRAMHAPVRNVPVANGVWPNPFTTHQAYLDHPKLLDGLLEAVRGDGRPDPGNPKAHRLRAWWTAAQLVLPAAVLFYFLGRELLPLAARAATGDPAAWAALALLIATLFWMA